MTTFMQEILCFDNFKTMVSLFLITPGGAEMKVRHRLVQFCIARCFLYMNITGFVNFFKLKYLLICQMITRKNEGSLYVKSGHSLPLC